MRHRAGPRSRCDALGRGAPAEVIAFPKTAKAIDLMADAPTAVTDEQLKELHIRVALKS